jgi:hypothetical protein
MTSLSIERPTRSPRRAPHLAHLRLGEATYGQPVTVEITDEGAEETFPATFFRTERGMMRCITESGESRLFFPRDVFPRREPYRRWIAVFTDRDNSINVPVPVIARTVLEARANAAARLHARFGSKAGTRFTFRSAKKRAD